MKRVVTQKQMKNCDNNAIKSGTPSITLMEKAANAVTKEFIKIYKEGKVAIICGGGNNGGDGIATARLLYDKGITSDVYIFCNNKTKDFEINLERLKKLPVKIYNNNEEYNFKNYDYIIDALFGTGINKAVTGIYKNVIENINNSKAYILSIDMPSGLYSDTGKTNNVTVKANSTISLAAYKYGQLIGGLDNCGDIIVKDIDINVECGSYVYEKEDIKKFFPKRLKQTHKGSFGKLCIIAGSGKYFGAALISYNGAASLYSGAGLTVLAIPKFLSVNYRNHIKECVLEYLDDNGENSVFNYTQIKNIMKNCNSICIGMGMGNTKETFKICKTLIEEYDKNLLLDADALNSIAKYDKDIFKKGHNKNIIITPHLKEFSRLTDINIEEIKDNPIKYAQEYAKDNNITVLLKGASTIITNGNITAINTTGTPAMAKAGSGDVLSGIIGGIMVQGHNALNSGIIGAYIHGMAGEFAKEKSGEYSVIASDICNNIANVIKSL